MSGPLWFSHTTSHSKDWMQRLRMRDLKLWKSGKGVTRSLQTALKMENTESSKNLPAFRKSFKYFKARKVPPDLSGTLDVRNESPAMQSNFRIEKASTLLSDKMIPMELGLTPVDSWQLFHVRSKPGLVILPRVLIWPGQIHWAKLCLKSYTRKPNATNLDKFLTAEDREKCMFSEKSQLQKLRWATLGYQYDWDEKVYREESRSKMPEELVALGKILALAMGVQQFQPEAVIVNYYRQDSTLSGHVDRSEWNMEAPLLSVSLGQTGLYLQGGATLEEEPVGVFLRSGDALVMQGKERESYHGVPRIIKDLSLTPEENGIANSDNTDILSYLSENRINITIRQVN